MRVASVLLSALLASGAFAQDYGSGSPMVTASGVSGADTLPDSDLFERASLGTTDWTQITWDSGSDVEITGSSDARADGPSADSIAMYDAKTPDTASWACIEISGTPTAGDLAGPCLGVDDGVAADDDAVCCGVSDTDEVTMNWWLSGVWSGSQVDTALSGCCSAGDHVAIERTASNTFECAWADASTPTTWNRLGTETIANVNDPGYGGIDFYDQPPMAEAFTVGNGTLPASGSGCGTYN